MSIIKAAIRNSFLWKNEKCKSFLRKIAQIKNAPYYKRRKEAYEKYNVDTLMLTLTTLKDVGLLVFPASGTLLGLYREGKLLEHDVDLDFGVVENGAFSVEKVKRALEKNGYICTKIYYCDNKPLEICFQSPFSKYMTLDIFVYVDCGNIYHAYGFGYYEKDGKEEYIASECDVPKFSELKPLSVYDTVIDIPENVEQYLICLYGETWRIPDKKWDVKKENPYRRYLLDSTVTILKD